MNLFYLWFYCLCIHVSKAISDLLSSIQRHGLPESSLTFIDFFLVLLGLREYLILYFLDSHFPLLSFVILGRLFVNHLDFIHVFGVVTVGSILFALITLPFVFPISLCLFFICIFTFYNYLILDTVLFLDFGAIWLEPLLILLSNFGKFIFLLSRQLLFSLPFSQNLGLWILVRWRRTKFVVRVFLFFGILGLSILIIAQEIVISCYCCDRWLLQKIVFVLLFWWGSRLRSLTELEALQFWIPLLLDIIVQSVICGGVRKIQIQLNVVGLDPIEIGVDLLSE